MSQFGPHKTSHVPTAGVFDKCTSSCAIYSIHYNNHHTVCTSGLFGRHSHLAAVLDVIITNIDELFDLYHFYWQGEWLQCSMCVQVYSSVTWPVSATDIYTLVTESFIISPSPFPQKAWCRPIKMHFMCQIPNLSSKKCIMCWHQHFWQYTTQSHFP
jgi:hypothetical protein